MIVICLEKFFISNNISDTVILIPLTPDGTSTDKKKSKAVRVRKDAVLVEKHLRPGIN